MLEIVGLPSVFIINLIGSATIIFPIPGFTSSAIGATFMNPYLVGIVGGFGAAIGEMTGFALGYGSKKALSEENKWVKKTGEWFEKYPAWFITWLFAFSPLPFDVVGILAGSAGYDIKKFFLCTLGGKIPRMILIALFGATLIDMIMGWI